MLFQAETPLQHPGRIQEGVAVHDTVPHEFRVLQAGDHGEDPLLLAPLEVGLEAHDIVERPILVLGPELDIGPGAVAGARVNEAHRAQRAEAHGVGTPGGHDLNGHTALVDRDGIRFFCRGHPGRAEQTARPPVSKSWSGARSAEARAAWNASYSALLNGQFEVIGLAPVIAGSGKHFFVIETFRRHDGGHGVVKNAAARRPSACRSRRPGHRPSGGR